MTKIKSFLLCVASSVVTAVLVLSLTLHDWKNQPTALVLNGPTTVNIGDEIEYKATAQNPGWFLSKTVYQWKILHKDGSIKYHNTSDNNIFFPAGTTNDKLWVICSAMNYHNAIVTSWVEPLDIVVAGITVGNPVPPTPVPPVPPTPTPVSDKLFVVYLYDSAKATSLSPDQLALKGSQTINPVLTSLNATWKEMDKANPALSDTSWQKYLADANLPEILILDVKGKVYYSGSAKNETDTITQVKILRGVK